MKADKVWRVLCLAGMVLAVSSCLGPCLRNPPLTFQDADLVGVWEADYAASARFAGWWEVKGMERLTLRADGTYQQVYDDGKGHVQVKEGQPWTTERFPDGRVRLWLEGGMCYPCMIMVTWPRSAFPVGGIYPERWYPMFQADDGTGHPVDLDGTKVLLVVQMGCRNVSEIVLSHVPVDDPDSPVIIRFHRVE